MRSRLLAAVGAAALACAALASGQPQKGQGGPPAPTPAGQAEEGPAISIEFPGGTLEDFVRAVQEAAGETPVNVIVPPEAADLAVEPLTLRRVTPRIALEVAVATGLSAFKDHPSSDPFNPGPSLGVIQSQGSAPVYIVRLARAGDTAPPPARPRNERLRVEIFDVTGAIGAGAEPREAVAPLLTAVETALGFEDQPAADVRYHPDSRLLIVRGLPEQLDAVRSVVATMNNAHGRREAERADLEQRIRQLRAELADHEAALRELEARRRFLNERRDQVRVQAEAGQASSLEVRELEAEDAALSARIDAAGVRLRTLHEALADLERRRQQTGADVSVERYRVPARVAGPAEALLRAVASIAEPVGTVRASAEGDGAFLAVEADERGHRAVREILSRVREIAGGGE